MSLTNMIIDENSEQNTTSKQITIKKKIFYLAISLIIITLIGSILITYHISKSFSQELVNDYVDDEKICQDFFCTNLDKINGKIIPKKYFYFVSNNFIIA